MTHKFLSTAALALVGTVILAASSAHATGIGGAVSGNGGNAGVIGAAGGTGGVGNGAASQSFGGMGQPGTDLPGSGAASASAKASAGANQQDATPSLKQARQIDRQTRHEDNRNSADYQVAQARKDTIKTQSRAAVDSGATASANVQ